MREKLLSVVFPGHFLDIIIMGAAHYIVLERKIDGLDTSMNGKSLSRHIEALDEAARTIGIRPLSDFFSADPEQMAEFMEDGGMDADDFEFPPIRQFSAQEGVATIQALAAHPAASAEGVAQDLRECERILKVAAQHGVGWHFEIDI
jgi:hypothetical protein